MRSDNTGVLALAEEEEAGDKTYTLHWLSTAGGSGGAKAGGGGGGGGGSWRPHTSWSIHEVVGVDQAEGSGSEARHTLCIYFDTRTYRVKVRGSALRDESVWRLVAAATAFGSVRPTTEMLKDELCKVGERLVDGGGGGGGSSSSSSDPLLAELARVGMQKDATLSNDAVGRASLGITPVSMRGSDLGLTLGGGGGGGGVGGALGGGAANGESESDGGGKRGGGANVRGGGGGGGGGSALWDDKAEELLNAMDWVNLTATELDEQLLKMMDEVEHETVECLFAWEHVRDRQV